MISCLMRLRACIFIFIIKLTIIYFFITYIFINLEKAYTVLADLINASAPKSAPPLYF